MSDVAGTDTAAHCYKARARWDGDFWVVFVEGMPDGSPHHSTQGRTFKEAERMACDYVACFLDIAIETVNVELRIA